MSQNSSARRNANRSFVYRRLLFASIAGIAIATVTFVPDGLFVQFHIQRLRNMGLTASHGQKGGYFIAFPDSILVEDTFVSAIWSIDWLSRYDKVTLKLDNTGVSNSQLQHLIQVKGPIFVSLRDTDIDDDAVEYLKRIPMLTGVDSSGTSITIDPGLRNINKQGYP